MSVRRISGLGVLGRVRPWVSVLVVSSLALAACSQAPAAPAQPAAAPAKEAAPGSKVTIRLGALQNTDHHEHKAAERFAELVAQKTNNRVEVKLFPGGQLGTGRDMTEAIRQTNLEMTLFGADLVEAVAPFMGALVLPFMWDKEKAKRMLDGAFGKEIAEKLRGQIGVRVLAWSDTGDVSIITRSKAIRTPEDMKGQKIRVPEVPSTVRAFQLWGANPTVITFVEVYNALQTGVVDGAATLPPGMVTTRWHEVSKHLSLTRHIYLPMNVLISDEFYQSQPADIQTALSEAGHEAFAVHNRDLYAKAEIEAIETMKKAGVAVVEQPDREAFRNGIDVVWKEFGEKVPDAAPIIKTIQETQ